MISLQCCKSVYDASCLDWLCSEFLEISWKSLCCNICCNSWLVCTHRLLCVGYMACISCMPQPNPDDVVMPVCLAGSLVRSMPAFGSAPAFGQQSAAATPSLFGSSQAGFGTPQPAPATTSTFGAPAGGLFGTPQSTPAMFGTPQNSTAFGAPTPSFGGFGQTQFGGSASTTFGKPAQSTTNKKSSSKRR